MRFSVGRFLFILLLVAVGISFTGCATRHYVKHQIQTIEPQLAEVRNVQAEQAERIDAVDRRANAAMDAADQAIIGAAMANEKAIAADRRGAEADRRADTAQVNALRALNRIDTMETSIGNRIASLDKYRLASQTAVTFKFDSDVLSAEAISMLDDLVGPISLSSTGYLVEIQGFTDSIGTEKYNFGLSERRAESVLRFLVSKGIPLYRISIVGFGKASSVADNKTVGGREQNRRVEIRVLRSSETATANR